MKKSRLLNLILILALVALILVSCGEKVDETQAPEEPPAPEFTEGLIYATEGEGACKVIGYEGTDTDVIMPAEYGGYKVVSVGNSAFAGNKNITSVTLGENVKRIESAAFAGCEKLVALNLGTSLEEIGSAAFFGCYSLKTVSVPATLKKVGIDAFSGCYTVTEINFDGNQSMWSRVSLGLNNEIFDTKLVLADGGALVKLIDKGDCTANISWRLGYDGILFVTGNGHIPDYEIDTIPWRNYTESITSIVVEEGIDIIGKKAFLSCTEVTEVSIASTVKLIDNDAFYGCSALGKITLPEKLRRLGDNAFFGCSSLESVVIPETVTAIGSGAFMGCSALESVTLPAAITSIDNWTFANCENLKTINLENVTEVGTNAFFRCTYIPAKYQK